ncbi:NAD-dependent epimerase/dehydratase family protein [Streptomyces rectiverticillatus]|uniref:SDR family oxidoreductase n=1 Tax=Streptomyces rectiverticillatus TaxID=173860 RepID=UPI0015C3A7B5|nr:SDR family oxidoreductase [Streptomyces rectiverticillatus]QLE74805.1 NAD-dependent epimerase/dehydratase family protein [Streptomyces rectiverticillatus]
MTVVITGATGFVGSRLLRGLLAGDRRVTALGRDGAGRPLADRLQSALRACGAGDGELARARERLTAVPVDLTRPGLGLKPADHARLAEEAEAVWHCAAALSLIDTAEGLFAVNVTGTRHIAELTDHSPAHVPLLHVSTAYVAAGADPEPDLPGGQALPSAPGAVTGYERTKQQAEEVVRAWAESRRRPALVLRPSLLATDRPLPPDAARQPLSSLSTYLATLIEQLPPPLRSSILHRRALLPRIRLRLLGDPAAHVNIVPVEYAVDAALRLAALPHRAGVTTYHLVHPVETPAALLVAAVNELVPGVEIVLQPAVDRPNLIEQQIAPGLAAFLRQHQPGPDGGLAPLHVAVPGLADPAPLGIAYLRAAMTFLVPGTG